MPSSTRRFCGTTKAAERAQEPFPAETGRAGTIVESITTTTTTRRQKGNMADLELIYIQMFPEEGDPGWHAGQLTDGRRVHAAAIPCNPGELH